MRISCDVMADLLPLYKDEICSEDSRKLVEEHLAECEGCKKRLTNYSTELQVSEKLDEESDYEKNSALEKNYEMSSNEKIKQDINAAKSIKKGLRKMQGRMALRVVCAIVLVICVGVTGLLGVNEVRGEGVSFSSIRDVSKAEKFLAHLQKGRYEEAADMLDFEKEYEDMMYNYNMGGIQINGSTSIQVNGQLWYQNDDHAKHMQEELELLKTDEAAFWKKVIDENICCVLIPEEIWNLHVSEEETKNLLTTDLDTIVEDKFVYIQSQWGNYYTAAKSCFYSYVEDDYIELPLGNRFYKPENAEISGLYYSSLIVPEAIYVAAEQYVNAENREHVEWVEEAYSEWLSLTKEEFVEKRRQHVLDYWKANFATGKYEIVEVKSFQNYMGNTNPRNMCVYYLWKTDITSNYLHVDHFSVSEEGKLQFSSNNLLPILIKEDL